jgi:hypothetical protein
MTAWVVIPGDENTRENMCVMRRTAVPQSGVSPETKLAGHAYRNPRVVRRPE